MLVHYIFADTMSHDKETNADVTLANNCLVTKPVLTAKYGAFFWDDSGKDQWSQMTRIMFDQMNRLIHSRQGFIGSLDLPWSEWSGITDPDLDHPIESAVHFVVHMHGLSLWSVLFFHKNWARKFVWSVARAMGVWCNVRTQSRGRGSIVLGWSSNTVKF